MGSRQIVLVSTAGFSVLNTGIFWREAKTKRLFSQCTFFTVYGGVLYEMLQRQAFCVLKYKKHIQFLHTFDHICYFMKLFFSPVNDELSVEK